MWRLILLLLAVPTFGSCPKGSTEYQGMCAADLVPETAPAVVPSDEKPPRHPEPAWQRGEVKAETPTSLQAHDANMDQDRKDAEYEGKKAAGIN